MSQDHLARARELGVSLEEYADAYDVDIHALQCVADSHKKASPDLSDFVAVQIEPATLASPATVLTLTNNTGHCMAFHD